MPELSPEAIEAVLRECVTLVRPGETLIIRAQGNDDDIDGLARALRRTFEGTGVRGCIVYNDIVLSLDVISSE